MDAVRLIGREIERAAFKKEAQALTTTMQTQGVHHGRKHKLAKTMDKEKRSLRESLQLERRAVVS